MRTFQPRLSLRHVATALALFMACQAHAGRFTTAEFGPVRAEDIADIVTEAFTQRFPANRWSIFLYSSVTFSGTGQPSCHAITGVTPKGQDRFPVHSYSSHVQRMKPQSMSLGVNCTEFCHLPQEPAMGFSASDVVPFTQARANLSELADQAKAGAEKIITKNGESYVALIDAERLDYYHRLERERIHLLLIDDARAAWPTFWQA
jgi:prevent-host-death family protein